MPNIAAALKDEVTRLAHHLDLLVAEFFTVGDAVFPCVVANAVHEGFRVRNAI